MKILANSNLLIHKQVRFPKSKKRRIRKKWERRSSNWHSDPDPNIYAYIDPLNKQQVCVAHPLTIKRLQNIM
jgi:hypothetical protein